MEARAARRDGFTAKAVIHPKHIEVVHSAFDPSDDEIAWAQSVVNLLAADQQLGVASLDGKMIDKPHLRAAERILAAAGLRSSAAGETA